MGLKDFVVVIPARYRSTRLPGKPLIDLEGKSMLLRTYEQCLKAVSADLIFVATDHDKIYQYCLDHHIQVEMTSAACLTGTDRIAEFSKKVSARTYINVQGDEPLMNPDDLKAVIKAAIKYPEEIINGYAGIDHENQYLSPHVPKVVFRPDQRLLYMSRSPIPGNKNNTFKKSWRQICIYGFPKNALSKFVEHSGKTELEQEEDIEILRFLELGYEVRMIELSKDSVAVDTPEDATVVRNILKNNK
tara:strand:+ start:867 stop:1604 length:738 start_codon:yes stop_codon:yes gene_type:complete